MSKDQGDSVQESASQPVLCVRGCGFFGNQACGNMCSKCYREVAQKQEREKANEVAAVQAISESQPVQEPRAIESALPEIAPAPASPEASSSGAVAAAATEEEPPSEKPVQTNPSRCFSCNKRVGLTGFKCRCGYIYCAGHRYAEKHSCGYDYKTSGRQHLADNNPLVMASKLEKI